MVRCASWWRSRRSNAEMPRTLIAGFGNELRGDDGFGITVLHRLRNLQFERPGVTLLEVGTAGIRLAQELLDPYDRLIIVDAIARGGAPGTVYTLAVDDVDATGQVDMHVAVPSRALAITKALGGLPREVWIVGCEPGEVDELTTEMTPAVRGAIDTVVGHVQRLLGADAPAPALDLERRDEVLQVMFWLTGEGLGPDVTVDDITRFVGDERAVVTILEHLVAEAYAEPIDDGPRARYRLTSYGEVEGRRRFLDEFEPYLAKSAHGECGNADCDCRTGGECRAS